MLSMLRLVESFPLSSILLKQISKLVCLTTKMNLNIMRCGRIWPYPFCCQHDYSCLVLEGRCQPQFLFQTNMDLKLIIAKSFSYQWQQGLFCFLGSFKKVPLRPTVRQECKLDKTAALIITPMTRNYV